MINYERLKNIVLLLTSIILTVIIVKYLKIVGFFLSLLKILAPVFIGFIYAWLFNPLITKLGEKYKRNIVSVILFLLIIFILGLFLYYLIPTIYKEVDEVAELMPDFLEMISMKLHKYGMGDSIYNALDMLAKNAPIYILNIVKYLFKYVGVIGIGLILGLYMSIDYGSIIAFLYSLIPKKYKCVFINLSMKVSSEVRKCVNGTLFVAFMVFVGDFLAFSLIGLDAPLLVAMLCGITDLIPYVGPYIGGAVAVLVGFTESRLLGIFTLIVCVIVQAIENYILQPMVMSKSIKISPVLIIVGLLVFGNLFGIVGMVLATPIVAFLKVVCIYIKETIESC